MDKKKKEERGKEEWERGGVGGAVVGEESVLLQIVYCNFHLHSYAMKNTQKIL